jgi:putative transposase
MTTRSHSQLQEKNRCYFTTCTVAGWKHVFVWRSLISIVIDSILFFHEKRDVKTVGYCLMPNHLHWIFILPENFDGLAPVIRTFKSYTATAILVELRRMDSSGVEPVHAVYRGNPFVRVENPGSLLDFLSLESEPAKHQFHRFWRENSDIKAVCSEVFLREKLNYIHNNPLQPHWVLAKEAADYPFSSCRYYWSGKDWNGIEVMQLL